MARSHLLRPRTIVVAMAGLPAAGWLRCGVDRAPAQTKRPAAEPTPVVAPTEDPVGTAPIPMTITKDEVETGSYLVNPDGSIVVTIDPIGTSRTSEQLTYLCEADVLTREGSWSTLTLKMVDRGVYLKGMSSMGKSHSGHVRAKFGVLAVVTSAILLVPTPALAVGLVMSPNATIASG